MILYRQFLTMLQAGTKERFVSFPGFFGGASERFDPARPLGVYFSCFSRRETRHLQAIKVWC